MALVINRLSVRRINAADAGESLPVELHDLWWDVNLMLPWRTMTAIQSKIENKGPLEVADVLIPALLTDWNVQYQNEDGTLTTAPITADSVGSLPTELVSWMLTDTDNGLMGFLDRLFRRPKAA